MTDLLTLTVLFACALSCSLAVLFVHHVVAPALKALWARLQASDDPFGDAAYGDHPALPTDFKSAVFHSSTNKDGEQYRGI